MATKSELIQAINAAFSGEQQRAVLELLELATRPATDSTPGVVIVGSGLDVDSGGTISVSAG